MDERELRRLRRATGDPPEAAVTASRQRLQKWFVGTAPLIRWDVLESPLGPLYLALSARGLQALDFGVDEADFLGRLDPLARTQRDPAALAALAAQLRAYFAGQSVGFDTSLDLTRTTPFQRQVLQVTRRIPWGSVWTYGEIARAIDRPKASRAVGQALGRNPVPIVIPCHRVIGSGGGLRGYGAGAGVESKRWLLQLEGALG